MSEISKLIIPGNTIPYDLRDDYAREKINNNHLFIVSPLRTGIVNAYALLGRDVEPYEGLMLHILCSNDQNDSIAPASIRLEENGSIIPIDYATSAGHPINNQIYSFILHQIPEEGATPAYWNFYPMDDGLISKGIKIIEYTTGASTAYTQVENAIIAGQLPVVHVSDSTNEYYLPLYGFLDTDTYYFVANLMKDTFTVELTTTAWQTINMNLLGEEDLSYIVQTVPQTLSTAYKAQARTNIDAATGQSVYYGTCDTGSTTAAKVVTGVSNWPTTLSAGQIILIRFAFANTAANPTLSINGSTAAAILTYNGASSTITWDSDAFLLFIYDGRSWRLVDGENDTLSDLGIGYSSCSTELATLAKVVTIIEYKLKTGGLVAVKFTYSVPANSTLNITGTGAKAIYYNGTAIQSNVIQNGDIALFVYTGSVYELLTTTSKNSLPLTTSTDYIISTTAAATTTKTATLSGFALPTSASPSGRTIAINFINSVPANAKLNISYTGARNIICNNANITANTIQANDVVTLESYWNSSLTTPTAQYRIRAIDRNNIRHVYQNTLGIHNASTESANGHIYESPTDIKGYWSATMSTGSTTATAPTVYFYNMTNGFADIAPDMTNQLIGSAYVEIGSKGYEAPIILDEIATTTPVYLRAHLANFTAGANSTPTYHLQIACPKK